MITDKIVAYFRGKPLNQEQYLDILKTDNPIDPFNEYYPRESGNSVHPLVLLANTINWEHGGEQLYFNTTGTSPAPMGVWNQPAEISLSNDLIEKLWEKMYSQPVLVRCPHCDSVNVVTSPTCVQCGAPMGQGKRIMSKR